MLFRAADYFFAAFFVAFLVAFFAAAFFFGICKSPSGGLRVTVMTTVAPG